MESRLLCWTICFLLVVWCLPVLPCPSRCLCLKSTVRCMHLMLDHIPQVPQQTTVLDLRFNRIREIPGSAFKKLKNLNTLLLNNNQIRQISRHAFEGLENLLYLYIHFNQIETLQPETFGDLLKLERLFLHNNKLSKIPAGSFSHLDSLKRLRLDSNALVCDCDLMWLGELMQGYARNGQTQAAATCEYPRRLQGRSIASLPVEEFNCESPRITFEPQDVEVTSGNTVYFTCRAEGNPKPKIIWIHNNNFSFSLAPPQFTIIPRDQVVLEGHTVEFLCEAEGNPPPVIAWTKAGGQLPQEGLHTVLSSGTLRIDHAAHHDQGQYECQAVSPLGVKKASVQLTVKPKGNVCCDWVYTPEECLFMCLTHIPGFLVCINLKKCSVVICINNTVIVTFTPQHVTSARLCFRLYGSPGDIDFWPALMVEDLIPGTRVGPTLMCLFVTQFQRLRDGDRFWYENPGVFTPAQLTQLKQASLGRVLCDNGDNIQQVQADVFVKAQYPQDYLSCSEIPQVDLRVWQDCCEDCRSRGQFRAFTQESREKRSAQYSYPDEKDTDLSDLISRQQDHLYIDEDDRNVTLLAKANFAQDFSSFAVEIQKTIKALREQINKLEARLRQAGCTDDKGIRRKDNEHWMKEDCISCMCKSGQVTCMVKTCPPAPCPSLELVKGTCCPVCRDPGMPADSPENR
nr:probable oxidoreductase PXDNL [Mirounga angustirostris]